MFAVSVSLTMPSLYVAVSYSFISLLTVDLFNACEYGNRFYTKFRLLTHTYPFFFLNRYITFPIHFLPIVNTKKIVKAMKRTVPGVSW